MNLALCKRGHKKHESRMVMETNGQAEGQYFLKSKALDYFCNYLRQYKRMIYNQDFFKIIEESLDKDEVVAAFRRSIPEGSVPSTILLGGTWDEMVSRNNTREILEDFWVIKNTRAITRAVILELVEIIRAQLELERGGRDHFSERFNELCGLFKLSEIEGNVMLLCHLLSAKILEPPIQNQTTDKFRKLDKLMPWLETSAHLVRQAVGADQKLRKYNCIDDDLVFNPELNDFLYGWTNEPLASNFYMRAKGEALPWAFHGALAEKHGAILKDLILHRNPKRGLHILLYGAPGAGKTSFAKSLATELGLTCYGIVQDVKNDKTSRTCSTPDFRFGALRICDSHVDSTKSLLIVDEADEMLKGFLGGGGLLFALLGGESTASGDKGLLNSVLDEIKTPCIWIANTPARMLDPSSRRRFDYSIRFDKLTFDQRRSIWKNNVEKFKLEGLFPAELQDKLADKYEVSAGGITLVLQNLADLKPEASECEKWVEKLMAPHCELLGIQTDNSKLRPAADYSLEGLNIQGDIPLEQMVEAVRRFQAESKEGADGGIDRPRMNLLLSGAPGTGKTEFVKYLGSALKTKIVVKMGADLLDMYVGGTEQNIRRAFEEAEAEKAILFLDEIDGLLQNREQAVRSWEVTQVNELLHRLENFNGVMIGATNFTKNLDPAVVRRFTFKLEFRYLDEAGKVLFYERMFRAKLSPTESKWLVGIPDLAPGDFRTVRQGLHYLGKGITNEDRLAALERESQAKGHNRYTTKKIGF